MHTSGQNFQSIAEAAAYMQSLRRRSIAGEDVMAEAQSAMDLVDTLECQSVADVVALIGISQQVLATMFTEFGGDIDAPFDGDPRAGQIAALVQYMGRSKQALEWLVKNWATANGATVN